jgi:hypothetical protein
VLRNKSFYTDFSEAGGGATMRRLTLLGMAEAVGVESLGGLTEEETEWVDRILEIDRKLMPPKCARTCRSGCSTSWSPSMAKKKRWNWPTAECAGAARPARQFDQGHARRGCRQAA